MKKSLFTAFAVWLGLTVNVMAQVPNYVPTNGLVGWWPFNGNANDESGNGNNGTVNGATLTTDRFGNSNKAYSFDGYNDLIRVPNQNSLNLLGDYTVTVWFEGNFQNLFNNNWILVAKRDDGGSCCSPNVPLDVFIPFNSTNYAVPGMAYAANGGYSFAAPPNNISLGLSGWQFLSISNTSEVLKFYVNGVLVYTTNFPSSLRLPNTADLLIGSVNREYGAEWMNGKLDDVAIWNRALTQAEITALYNSCAGTNIISQPTNALLNVGSNTQFSVSATLGSTYQWQSNPSNFGWQNVPSNAAYSGGTTNSLTVNNAQLSNHNQSFRAIVNAGGCIDTSNVATIQIADTCIATIYDTLLTTVTGTLIINTTLSLPAPNNENTLLVYPNPTNDHITIDNGNYIAMVGYSIKITNNAGQQVFQSAINQAQFYIDLSTWSGNGLYFVHLIDPQNNTLTVRKIVLQ